MQRTRFWALVCVGAIAPWTSLSCGSEEGTSSPSAVDDGGEAGERPSAFAGNAGDAAAVSGGNSGGAPGGGSRAAGGAQSTGGQRDGGGDGGALGLAGAGGSASITLEGEQLELCARLTGNVDHAYNVGTAFGKATHADCRVKWVIPRMQGPLVDYKNELVIWSLELWGCQGTPVDTFALVHGTPTLSPGDVTLLTDHYMAAAQNELD